MSQSPTGTVIVNDTYVSGPTSATDNAIARFDATTGRLIQNSSVTIADSVTGAFIGSFSTIAVSGQSDIVVDSAADTLTVAASSNMTVTNTAASDTITFAMSGVKIGGVKSVSNASTTTPSDSAGTATDIVINNSGTQANTITTGSNSGFTVAAATRPTIQFNQTGTVMVTASASTSGAATSPAYVLILYVNGVEVTRKPFENVASYMNPTPIDYTGSYTSGQEIKLMCAQTGGGTIRATIFTDCSISVMFIKDN